MTTLPAMRNACRLGTFLLLAALTFAATSCGGGDGGGKSVRLLVIDQNVLHGFINEDPVAEPFDRFPERLGLLTNSLAGAGADVIALQETLVNGPEGYPDVRAALRDALGEDYELVFGDFLGEEIGVGGLGQITLSRLPVVSSGNRSVSAIRSVVRVTVQTDLGPVTIYNAHLEGTGAVLETGEVAELQEIENVISFIHETRAGGPAILAGDLNAEPGDPSIERLLEEGFIDALAEAGDATCDQAGDPGCTNSTLPVGDNEKNLAEHRIDYIFVLPGDAVAVTVAEASLFNSEPVDIGEGHTLWPSDHIGVRAVVELKSK